MQFHGANQPQRDVRTQRLLDKSPFQAVVVRVNDGDTIAVERVTHDELLPRIEYIRLAGIDAPEVRSIHVDQARWSQQALAGQILGKQVTIQPTRIWRDPFSRIIARVLLAELDLNSWMVQHGHARRKTATNRI